MAAVAHERLDHDRPRRQPRLASVACSAAAPAVSVGEPVSTPPRARRPVFAAMLVMALLVVGGSIVDAVAPVAGRPQSDELSPSLALSTSERREHVVQPGETYWSIAEALGGGADIRDRVDALQAANGGRPLRAGDRLTLPVPE